jgi:hypothetical protein
VDLQAAQQRVAVLTWAWAPLAHPHQPCLHPGDPPAHLSSLWGCTHPGPNLLSSHEVLILKDRALEVDDPLRPQGDL